MMVKLSHQERGIITSKYPLTQTGMFDGASSPDTKNNSFFWDLNNLEPRDPNTDTPHPTGPASAVPSPDSTVVMLSPGTLTQTHPTPLEQQVLHPTQTVP